MILVRRGKGYIFKYNGNVGMIKLHNGLVHKLDRGEIVQCLQSVRGVEEVMRNLNFISYLTKTLENK